MSKPARKRLNKKYINLYPRDHVFPLGVINIALLESGFESVQEAGGARYYKNPDGTLTMEMRKVFSDTDPTKLLSHTFKKTEWKWVKKK